MPDRQTQTDELVVENAPFTRAEEMLVHQMRRLRLKPSEPSDASGRVYKQNWLYFEDRGFLEISKGLSTILMPSSMAKSVRNSIELHTDMRFDAVLIQQVPPVPYSPPQSPSYLGPPEPVHAQLQLTGTPMLSSGFVQPASHYTASAMPQALSQRAYSSSKWAYDAASHPSPSAPPLLGSESSSPDSLGMTLPSPSLAGMYIDSAAHCAPHTQHSVSPDTANTPATSNGMQATRPRRARCATDDNDGPSARGRARSRRAVRKAEDVAACDEDESYGSGCLSSAGESRESKLHKPLNSFMLYRRYKSAELRRENPGLSVAQISGIISDKWWAESSEVKNMFKQQYINELDIYNAEKKRIQARQKRKKMERDEHAGQPRRSRSTNTARDRRSITLTGTRDLGSFAPEALAPAASGHQLTADMGFGVRHGEDMSYLGASSGIATTGTTTEIDRRVASPLEQLQTTFSLSAPGQHSPLAAMSLDSPAVTAAMLRSLTAPVNIDSLSSVSSVSTGMEWASAPGHSPWDSLNFIDQANQRG
ncbi:hypothetical protein H4R19_000186 [Coemansia spiralis]|nr:hypothetical protein H4R19_000186 [Coemansia spiralis]